MSNHQRDEDDAEHQRQKRRRVDDVSQISTWEMPADVALEPIELSDSDEPSRAPPEPLSAYTCPICFSAPTNATLTPCGHICCGACLFTAVKSTIRRNMAVAMDRAPPPSCPVCRAEIPGWDGRGGGDLMSQQLTPFGAALAGALGACFSNAAVYPLDVAKTRIQATSPTAKGKRRDELTVLSVLLDIYKREGIAGWYRGFAATMLNTFSMQYAYFFFYAFLRTSYIKRLAARAPPGSRSPVLSTAAELSLGAAAGALSQIFTIPVSVIATRQQVGHQRATDSDEDDDSFLGVAREIVREDGVTGLWLGIKPGMVLTINPAITYGVYERLKSVLVQARAAAGASSTLTPGVSFVLGAFSKTLATIATYPYIMAKVRIQARTSGDAYEEQGLPHATQKRGSAPRTGAVGLLIRVLETEGLVGWYQGMSAQIIKAVLSQALLFVSKEQFERWALVLMILWSKLRARS